MRRKQKSAWPRAAWIAVATIFAALALGCVAGSIWFDSYLRSRELLALIAQATGNAIRSDATLAPLQWTGSSAFSEQVTFTGRQGSAIRNASLSQVRTELNWRAAFEGVWRIEDLAITQLDVGLITPEETAGDTSKSVPSPTGLAAFLPRRFELAQAKIGAANISFGLVRASGMRLIVAPNAAGWMINGTGGTLTSPFLPKLGITSFRARLQGREIFLTESALKLGPSGKITATGESGSGQFIRALWDDVDSKDILDANAQRYLEGKLSGTAEFRPPGAVRGKVQLHDGRVENVPMLAKVADFTGNPSFRRMPLQEMSTDFTNENGLLRLSNFVAESKGLLRIEGAGQRDANGHIEGRFQIGVTPQTLQWLPGSRERVFTVTRNGYLWTDLKLGGTLESPTEDLSSRLAAAMGAAIIEQGVNLITNPVKAVEGAKGLLNTEPGKAVEGAKGLLNNVIGPLIP